mgnify:CR=1 FL=1|jgi:transcriptional regulator with XRE-family HTH domain
MRFSSDYELYHTISQNIKYYRKQKGLTQIQLAEEAKISISYLAKIEASGLNKSLSISVLNQIANALDIDIDKFFNNIKIPRS